MYNNYSLISPEMGDTTLSTWVIPVMIIAGLAILISVIIGIKNRKK